MDMDRKNDNWAITLLGLAVFEMRASLPLGIDAQKQVRMT